MESVLQRRRYLDGGGPIAIGLADSIPGNAKPDICAHRASGAERAGDSDRPRGNFVDENRRVCERAGPTAEASAAIAPGVTAGSSTGGSMRTDVGFCVPWNRV